MNAFQQAQANIRATLGISDDPTTWSYDQRQAYNRSLAQWIAANPDSVSSTETQIASGILNENATPLDDVSFLSEGSAFFSAFEDEALAAGDKIGGIGRGVLNLANSASWIIPLAGGIVVVILLLGFYKKQS